MPCLAQNRGARGTIGSSGYHNDVNRFHWPFLIGALVPTLAAWPQNLPDLGESSQADLTPQMERRIGESIMREIRSDPDYIDDPEISEYVQTIGYRLVSASPDVRQDFEFFVIRDRTVNAFALPGGYVGVHSGLILTAQSESEFASVLAHEISHVLQHHAARQMQAQSKVQTASLIAMALAILAAKSNPQVAGATMSASAALPTATFLSYSRDFEREADRVGFQILDASGYDPEGMPSFFERLQKATRLYDNNAPAYLRTHPLTTERIADMQARAADHRPRQRRDSPEFQLVRAKLRAADGTPEDAVAFFREALREKRFTDEAAMHYGYAAALARLKDFKGAEAQIDILRKTPPSHPMYETLAARIKTQAGDVAGAEKILAAARQHYPDVVSLKYDHAAALQTLGRNREAVDLANDLAKQRPRWARVYEVLGKAYAGVGNRTQQHRALAEFYYLQGGLASAREQLRLAQSAGDGDFYTLSVVDVRLREMRAQQAQEAKEKKQQ
jgi:predicted Zn-dependent protease